MADDRPTVIRCQHCGKRVKVKPTGRLPLYCNPTCRVLAFEKKERRDAADERMRGMMWELLQNAGVVRHDQPMPPRKRETE